MNYRKSNKLTHQSPSLSRLSKLFMVVITLVAIWCLGCNRTSVSGSDQTSSEDALKRFYDSNGPEDTLMDPLIKAGSAVVPLVLKEVKNKNMPRRRYAIAFLGNGSYREALPVLEAILNDPTEEDYIRGDALQSIYMIDQVRSKEFAQTYGKNEDYLGDVSRRIIKGDNQLNKRRSYLDAVAGNSE